MRAVRMVGVQMRSWVVIFLAVGLLAVSAQRASAVLNISYQATDLVDVLAGEDLWQLSYTLSGHDFQLNQGFTIYFNESLYANLESPPPAVNGDWDVLTVQPDVGLPGPGFYDALSLASGASLADSFTLSVVYLGFGAPGGQAFELYDLANGFSILGGGTTSQSAVPDGGGALVTVLATLFVMGCGRLRKHVGIAV